MSIRSDIGRAGGAIHVAQALHGYRNGHDLLASSHHLSREEGRALLELSDLSGSAARTRGFESYISGYPVPGERLYAFARTWLAAEGTRPGSVWTHTLLLTPEQLAIPNVANLARWFRRPLSLDQAVDYGSPLEIDEHDFAEPPREPTRSRLTDNEIRSPEIFEALYQSHSANRAILLPAASSTDYEEVLLQIWSIQWPELREHFSFCTGALSFRQVAGRPFDLQVIPQDRAVTIERSAANQAYLLTGERHAHSPPATWAIGFRPDHAAVREMRAFAWRFGPRLGSDRLSFGRVAQLHSIAQGLSDRTDWQSLLETVGAWYPQRSSAQALKSWALDESGSSLTDPLTSLDRLSVLSRSAAGSAFPGWWRSLNNSFLQAMAVDEPEFGVFLHEYPAFATADAREALVRLSAEDLSTEAFVALIGSWPDAVTLSALDLRPSVVMDPALWRSDNARSRALAWLRTADMDDSLVVAIVRAVIAAGPSVGLSDLADELGSRAIDAAFDLLGDSVDQEEVLQAGAEWAATLRTHPNRGVSWLGRSERPSAALARLVLEQFRPGDRRLRGLENTRWSEIVKRADPSTAAGTSVRAFALGIGFRDERLSASPLVAQIFQTVHDSAEAGRLSDDDWNKLKHAFPKPPRSLRRLIRNGGVGRGQVLRRALVEAFGQRNWPVADFLTAVSDTAVLARTVTENVRTKSGKRLGRRLNAALQGGDLVLSNLQRMALDAWIDD